MSLKNIHEKIILIVRRPAAYSKTQVETSIRQAIYEKAPEIEIAFIQGEPLFKK